MFGESIKNSLGMPLINTKILSFKYLLSIFSYFVFTILPYLFSFYIYGLWLSEHKRNVDFKVIALLNIVAFNSIFLGPGAIFGFPNANPFENPIFIYVLISSWIVSILIYKFNPFEKHLNTAKEKAEFFEN